MKSSRQTDADHQPSSLRAGWERSRGGHEARAIGTGFRPVFLRAAAEAVGRVQVALGVYGELVKLPERTGVRAVGAPEVKQLPVGVIVQQARVGASDTHTVPSGAATT